jgi:hypothetical protein
VSVSTLRLAESCAIGCMAASIAAWGCLRLRHSTHHWPIVIAAIAASLAAARGVGSERLMLGLLFAALACIEWLRTARGIRSVGLLLLVANLFAAMVLVRHAALAFLPGLWFLFGGMRVGERMRATGSLCVVAAWSACAWWGSHIVLGQQSQGWFGGVHELSSLLGAMSAGINRGIAPWPIGILLFLAA